MSACCGKDCTRKTVCKQIPQLQRGGNKLDTRETSKQARQAGQAAGNKAWTWTPLGCYTSKVTISFEKYTFSMSFVVRYKFKVTVLHSKYIINEGNTVKLYQEWLGREAECGKVHLQVQLRMVL